MNQPEIIGISGNYYTSYMPVAKFDKKKGIAIVFPKALCTASLVNQDGAIGIKLTFEAQDVNTTDLKQLMIVKGNTELLSVIVNKVKRGGWCSPIPLFN